VQLVSRTPEDSAAAAAALGRIVGPGTVIGLVGDLGAGKTLFVQGLARGLNVPRELRVVSPTFTLINEYPGGRLPLYHADLYRLEQASELDEIGLLDLMRGDGVMAIEWADRFSILPADALRIDITIASQDERRFDIGSGAAVRDLIAAWRAALAEAQA
jgi:tRNA threonylcarbamoyladenosine biosynthesis protein TsaE